MTFINNHEQSILFQIHHHRDVRVRDDSQIYSPNLWIARESQTSQRVRKDIEIEEILSSSTSKFSRFSVFDFANEENCARNREIVSSDKEKWSRQSCIINERLYISIVSFLMNFFENEIKKWMLNDDYRWVETSDYVVSRW
jgi:hypothetical protein